MKGTWGKYQVSDKILTKLKRKEQNEKIDEN